MSFSQTKDSDGHTLVSLWKPYYKAVDADKPQDQAKALETIKQEAVSKHLAWDFYDAASRYVQVKSSINWKRGDTAEFDIVVRRAERIGFKDIKKFAVDHPAVVSFYYNPMHLHLQY